MAKDIRITFTRVGDNDVLVQFPDEGVTTNLPVTPVGNNLYRLDAVPMLVEAAGFGDVVEADPIGSEMLRVRRVVQRNGWRTFTYVVTPSRLKMDWEQSLLRELEKLGGYWEFVMDGLLFVCIPPGNDLDPTEWIEWVYA